MKKIIRKGNFTIYNPIFKMWWEHGEGWTKLRQLATLYNAEEKKNTKLPKDGHWVRDRSWSLV